MNQEEPTSAPDTSGEPTGTPGRYQRSFGGLVGSMIVLVVVVTAFVVLRALNRDEPDVRAGAVDYLGLVRFAQGADQAVLYPPELPAGWRATRVDSGSVWSIALLTDDDEFVGVKQVLERGTSLEELVEASVDEDAEEGRAVDASSPVASRWRSFTDAGGDSGYAAKVSGQWVLVFGSAPAQEVLGLATSLTDAPL